MLKTFYLLAAVQSLAGFSYNNFQSMIECNSKSHIEVPETLEELQSIVNSAINSRTTVKVIGSRHSYTDVICTEGIPIHLKHFNKVVVNKDDMTATIGTGIELQDALDALHEEGVTIRHVPTYGGITIGGAIGLGAHGSSLKHPNTLSEYIVALKFIDGQGRLRIISEEDSDFSAFRVNLGLLGVVVEAEFKIVPSYKLIIHNWESKEDILIESPDKLVKMARKNDLFQFWWFPTSNNLVISEGRQIDYNLLSYAKLNLAPNVSPFAASIGSYIVEFLQYMNSTYLMDKVQKNTVESLYKATFGKESMYLYDKGVYTNTAHGFSHDLMANKCQSCPWGNGVDKFSMIGIDYSVSLPLRIFSEVIADMKKLFDKYPTSFPWFGLYFRFSTPTRGIMSLANGEEHFHIEWLSALRKNQYDDAPYGISIYQSLYQLLINKYGGRPHWGKTGLAYLNHDTISSRYYLELFQKAMQKYDPNGLFLNNFGKRLLRYSDEVYDIPSKVTRCAIGNYCICKKDSDCPKNYKCGSLVGYKVCY